MVIKLLDAIPAGWMMWKIWASFWRRLERFSRHSVWSKCLKKGGDSFEGKMCAVRFGGQEFHRTFI